MGIAGVCTGRDEELGWKSRPELGLPRPRTGEPRDGTCCLRAPAAYLSLGPGTLGKLSQTCLVPGQDTSGGSPSQAPQGFAPAEGAEPECGRVGVCMSVDPERHTLTHTHSHARTHAGPSAAPPRTFTPRPVLPVPRPVPSPCRWLLTNAAKRTSGDGSVSPPPRGGCPRIPPPTERDDGEKCPGLLPLRRPSARGSARRVPPRHVGRAGGDAAGGWAGRGTGADGPSRPAPPP